MKVLSIEEAQAPFATVREEALTGEVILFQAIASALGLRRAREAPFRLARRR